MWLGHIEDISMEEFKNFFFHLEKVKNGLKRKILAVLLVGHNLEFVDL